MKRMMVIGGAAAVLALSVGLVVNGTLADDDPPASAEKDQKILRPDELAWQDGPPSLPDGARMVLLHGDLDEKGTLALRLEVPAGYEVPPHWHPADENVTILEGTVVFGMGDKIDPKVEKALPPGGFFRMPAKHRHYARAETDAVVQIHSGGPWGINYVNPEDDPRGSSK